MKFGQIKSYKVGRWSSRILADAGRPPYQYKVGSVTTPQGIVAVYMQDGAKAATGLDIVRDGRKHSVWIERSFTERSLVLIAKDFAKQVFS